MKSRRNVLRLPAQLALIGAILFGALACRTSEDADTQVQRYVDSLTSIQVETKAANEAIDIPAPGAESDVGDATLWFEQTVEINERFMDALRGLGDPPPAIMEAHSEYLAAQSQLLALNRRIRDHLRAAGPDFDIAALANDPELGIAAQAELAEPAEDTCEDMKRAIGAAGVEVEWDCEP